MCVGLHFFQNPKTCLYVFPVANVFWNTGSGSFLCSPDKLGCIVIALVVSHSQTVSMRCESFMSLLRTEWASRLYLRASRPTFRQVSAFGVTESPSIITVNSTVQRQSRRTERDHAVMHFRPVASLKSGVIQPLSFLSFLSLPLEVGLLHCKLCQQGLGQSLSRN